MKSTYYVLFSTILEGGLTALLILNKLPDWLSYLFLFELWFINLILPFFSFISLEVVKKLYKLFQDPASKFYMHDPEEIKDTHKRVHSIFEDMNKVFNRSDSWLSILNIMLFNIVLIGLVYSGWYITVVMCVLSQWFLEYYKNRTIKFFNKLKKV